jgi:hypothetical protein
MTTRNMRGESTQTVTKPGWVEAVTTRALRGTSANRVFFDDSRNQHTSQKAWAIGFQNRPIDPWAVVQCSHGLFVIRGSQIMSRPWSIVKPRFIARSMADQPGRFWRDVLSQIFEGRDPQCEECSQGSPVAHFPFTSGHRIHCTCRSCF